MMIQLTIQKNGCYEKSIDVYIRELYNKSKNKKGIQFVIWIKYIDGIWISFDILLLFGKIMRKLLLKVFNIFVTTNIDCLFDYKIKVMIISDASPNLYDIFYLLF